MLVAAGVSRRTFYEVFTDREDCFLAAFDEGVARASRYVLDRYDPAARWIERVRAILGGLLAFLDAEPDTGRLLLVGSLGAGSETLKRRQQVLAQATAIVDEGRARPLPRGSSRRSPPRASSVGCPQCFIRDSSTPTRALSSSWPRPLTSMVALPYLGTAAAVRELARAAPSPPALGRHPCPIPCAGWACD